MAQKPNDVRWVSATPTTALVEERAEQQVTARGVRAQIGENLAAGVGVGVVLAGVWLTTHGAGYAVGFFLAPWPDGAQVVTVSAIAGAIAFGLLMAARFGLDEAVGAWDWGCVLHDLDTERAENANLRDLVASLQQENRTLRAEQIVNLQSATTRKADLVAAEGDVERAVADAKTILERAFRGLPWARDTMKGVGWTQSQWENARDAAVAARVIAYAGKNPKLVPASYALACSALEEYRLRRAKMASSTTPNGTTHVVNDAGNDERGRGGHERSK